jgi:hypothetical protein
MYQIFNQRMHETLILKHYNHTHNIQQKYDVKGNHKSMWSMNFSFSLYNSFDFELQHLFHFQLKPILCKIFESGPSTSNE